ncbi:phosphoglucosamine mutase [Taylorella equigenitalis]|nr:phosphoglucosamine mutase [Taylorella equigenitalis]WDU47169.1 phosphoglucosamine mutase [Taylorella equigenitalis]WDU48630.1 phosphoglucosamine mutase [Taylorella equigenitalis]WDU50162.1 phosphoglucosamine mutase [Taylorella equigenitalis]WDU52644.1 phosphoglucosamine mutase [Taylorella equigenitalis]WDU54115.1 phosphoglucosamine mutase [Taylorella equigenitalis]
MMSRKYFGTDGVRGEVGGDTINAEFALRLGYAAGKVLTREHKNSNRPTVLIGKDTRVSGYMLESALEAGLSAAGIDVLLAGPIPTPAVAYLTKAFRLDAGIVISASHNPYYDNGIKFFSGEGTKLPDEVELQIENLIDEPLGCVGSDDIGKARRISDASGRYIEFCKSTFAGDLNLRGLKIVVDAAHGAAYRIATPVFQELGAEVISIGDDPNGFNINDGMGALYPESIAQEVLKNNADYGIALDGDADRIVMCDNDGTIYNGDQLLYAIVKDRLSRYERLGRNQLYALDGVVGTLMTNYGLEKRLNELGIPLKRSKVGDRYVMQDLLDKGWKLGGESSGHILCLDQHTTGDGIISALQVLRGTVRNNSSLKDWLSDLNMYPQAMISVPCEKGFNWENCRPLVAKVDEIKAQLGSRGRVLIRPSGTEPKLRLMVEAEDEKVAQSAVDELAAIDLSISN